MNKVIIKANNYIFYPSFKSYLSNDKPQIDISPLFASNTLIEKAFKFIKFRKNNIIAFCIKEKENYTLIFIKKLIQTYEE